MCCLKTLLSGRNENKILTNVEFKNVDEVVGETGRFLFYLAELITPQCGSGSAWKAASFAKYVMKKNNIS